MKEAVVVGNLRVKPGEVGMGKLEYGSTRDGLPVGVPLMVVNGAGEGPTLWLQAAIHGLELPGIEVIRRLVREVIDPKALCGTLICLPTANPLALQAGAQFAPQDNVDTHAVFPGDPSRSISHQLAHLLYTEGILKCDYFIDIHANYWPAIMFIPVPLHGNKDVMQRSLAMAEAFGGLPICEAKNVPGWPAARAQMEGKPAFIVELLYLNWIDPVSVEVGVRGMVNVMVHVGMLDGAIQGQPRQKVPPGWYGRQFIFSKHGGLVTPLKDAGDPIRTGEVISIIRNIYGDIVEEVRSPADGYVRTVLFNNPNQAVSAGELMYSYLSTGPRESFFVVS